MGGKGEGFSETSTKDTQTKPRVGGVGSGVGGRDGCGGEWWREN